MFIVTEYAALMHLMSRILVGFIYFEWYLEGIIFISSLLLRSFLSVNIFVILYQSFMG